MTKITGKVKWFSNRKGFGFIEPVSDNSPTKDAIFVHQTSIFSDGDYRTLVEGADVEFEVETEEESGKMKAVNVTAPGGGSLKPPPKKDRKRGPRNSHKGGEEAVSGESGEDADGKKNGTTEKAPREPPFHDVISDDAKAKIKEHGIDLGRKMTVDVALGEARIKLGQGGYAALAHASGMVGEGTYTCDEAGQVNLTWEKCLVYKDDKWSLGDVEKLTKSFSLPNDAVEPVKDGETAETLWGADKPDPKDALHENEFKMKRIVLTRPPGRGHRRGGGKPSHKKEEAKAEAKAE